MANNLDTIIKFWIRGNNENLKIAFPAIIVGVSRLEDGFVDVKPLVNHINTANSQTIEYPVIHDVSLVFPSTAKSTICFPVDVGDFVELIMQSSDIQKFIMGNEEPHDPSYAAYNNLTNIVAFVGFAPFQKSCFNSNNYRNDFDNQDLNIVHNKNTTGEVSITLKSSGDIVLKAPTRLVVESKEVELVSDTVDAKDAVISTEGDVIIGGRSLKQFMIDYYTHTHTGNQGAPTSPPTPKGV